MSIKIQVPTTEIIIEILEGVLSGKYSRDEVREWRKLVTDKYDYIGPGVSLVPLKVGEGYYAWQTMASFNSEKQEVWGKSEQIVRIQINRLGMT